MKVLYKTIIHPAYESPSGFKYEERLEHKELNVQFCCKEMEKYWDDIMTFGGHSYFDSNPIVGIKKHTYEGDYDTYPITFCPFCTSSIQCVEQQKVRIVINRKTVVQEKVVEEETEVAI